MKKSLHALCMIGKYYLYGFTLQLLFINLIYAAPINAQGSLDMKEVFLSLNLEEATLTETFNAIKRQTEFSFIYDKRLIENSNLINLQVNNESLESILLSLAASHQLSFKQVDDKISVNLSKKRKKENALVVEVSISGTVVDQNGEPIPGVTVSVPGTAIG
ncbi:MAG: secretin and TonB N-terminal domain-containing protein, partial [Cyclobacteriaceae bacterium]